MSNYICARCNYESNLRRYMQRHFNRKRPCPKINDVILTDEIKQMILEDHVYHIPKPGKVTNITNITNNTQNNIIQMDPTAKIGKLFEQHGKDILNIQDSKYFKRMKNSFINHKDHPDPSKKEECRLIDDIFKEIIDFLGSFFDEDDPENNIYNCFIKSNIFHMFNDDEWEKRTIPKGMKQFIKILKTMIFDAYEVCLIRQMTNWKLRQKAKEALKDYYSLIYSFDNLPTFMEERNNDNKLLYNKNDHEYDNPDYDSFEYIDQLSIIWGEVIKEMKDYKKTKNTAQLKQIITNHSDETMKNLDYELQKGVELLEE